MSPLIKVASAEGSSPRMRGAQRALDHVVGSVGIIPADARSTLGYFVSCFLLGDHPRGCEEHWIDHRLSSHTAGSSPRMRGALERWLYSDVQLRIIPADAGSTSAKSSDMAVSADHPRGCGEHPPGSRVT